jgi:hypothetical protein
VPEDAKAASADDGPVANPVAAARQAGAP